MVPTAEPCPNCGELQMRAYCSACGEKRRDRDEWKLRHIVQEAFAEITDVEGSRMWQTLRLLIFKPGQLTLEHWRGKRRSYIGPIKLYLIFFALSVLLYSMHQPTAVYDIRTAAATDRTGNLQRELNDVAAERGVPVEIAAEEVNSRWQNYISASQLIYPLVIAAALKLLMMRRRLHFGEHAIFSVHVVAFILLSYLLVWPLYFLARLRTEEALTFSSPLYLGITVFSVAWPAVYVVLGLRRAYATSWLAAVARGAVLFVLYVAVTVLVTYGALALAFEESR
jgi:hypothetical protein